MSETNTNDERKQRMMKQARRMLRELYNLSEHASLTGAFRQGASEAAQGYNQILSFVEQQAVDTFGMFSPLPETATFDQVGVACRMLRAFLDDDESKDSKDIRVMVGKHCVEEEVGRIRDIGAVIREHLPDFLKIEKDGKRVEVRVETRTKSSSEGDVVGEETEGDAA